MVLLREENLPALKWPLARVINCVKGDDGFVRVADVKTSSGILRRPISKMAQLPIEQEEPEASTESISVKDNNPLSPSMGPDPNEPGPSSRQHDQPSKAGARRLTRDEQPGPSNYKRRRCLNPISLALFVCCILPTLASDIKVQPFRTQPGLYFESMGPAHLFSNEWSLVVYYNMTTYWQELYTLKGQTSQLNHICSLLKSKSSCLETVNRFDNIINQIQENNQLLVQQPKIRTKRAPLNIIGNIASSLFGILDSGYAEEMSNIINNIEGNEQHLLELLKNQTSIIDSTTNLIKGSRDAIDNQLKEFNANLNKTILEINAIKQELREQRYSELFNTLCVQLLH